MAFLSVVGLTACSGDEPKDSVKEIRMQVSAETGVMYAWGDDKKENPIECMLANPPADGSDRTYSLIRILQDRLVTEPEIPVDEEITSEDEFTHITQSMQSGEEVRYALILANVYKKGLQKLFGCGLGGTYQQYYDKKRSPKRLHHDTDRSRNRL